MKYNLSILLLCLFVFNACQMFQKTTSTETEKANQPEEEVVKVEKEEKAAGVQFITSDDLPSLLEQSAVEDKPIFVDFYADWCGPCKLMDRKVFSDKKFANYLNQNFINYKVDADEWNGIQLTAQYDVKVLPTLLFLDSNGKVLARKKGAAFQTELYNLGDQAIEAFEDRSDN